MSDHVQVLKMVLTGSRRGRTILLNGHAFIKGVANVQASPESFNAFLTLMARSYQAYPQGSAGLALADERDRANGLLGDLQANPPAPDGAPAPVQGAGDHPAGTLPGARELLGSEHAGAEAGSAGLVPVGPGHPDAGLGEGMVGGQDGESVALMRAIGQEVIKLDVKVDEQWTEEGLPSVDYIAAAVKNPAVTRDMIEAAVPAFNRRVAEDVAAGF